MSDFKVSIKNITSAADRILALEKAVSTSADAVKSVKSDLALQIRSAQRISSRLTVAGNALDAHRSALRCVAEAGGKAAEIYEQNEKKIASLNGQNSINNGENNQPYGLPVDLSWISKILPLITMICSVLSSSEPEDYEIDSVVFDDEGSYGGDQGSPESELSWWWVFPSEEEKEYREILRQYEPYSTYSDKELKAVIKKLNDEGCGYVAVINTIFAAFEGREEEFEKTFGFPMYKDGDLNFNHLLVDFYAATDNKDRSGEYSKNEDRLDDEDNKLFYSYKSDKTGRGTSQYDRDDRTHLYLDEKGLDVKVSTDYPVTLENFKELSKDGYVIISFRYGNLLNEDGSVAQYINGGHAMVVTGVTADGKYIVSSWGGKYYIAPDEMVIKDNNKTSFTFSYYQYDLGEG